MTAKSRDVLREALRDIADRWPGEVAAFATAALIRADAALDVPGASDPRGAKATNALVWRLRRAVEAQDYIEADGIHSRLVVAASVQQGEPSLDVDELTDIGNVLLAAGKGPAHDHEMCAGCDSDEEIIGEAASRIGRLLARLRSQPSKERQP